GGNIVAQGGGNIVAQGGGNIVATGAGNIVAQGGGNIVAQGGGNGPQNKVAAEQLEIPATAPTFTQIAGESDLSGLTIIGGVSVAGGTLDGSGAIIGDLANSGGLIVPGSGAPGSFGVTGAFSQSGGGSLQVETSGGNPTQFDQLQAGGGATLGGNLFLHTRDGYQPLANDSFNPVGYSNVSGAFDTVSSNVQATPLATGITSVLAPGAPNPFALLKVVSRKTQGIAGIYDIPLSLGQPIGVECRSSGGQHTLVFTFNNPIVGGSASITSGTGQISGTPLLSDRTMTVSLTGVANAQRLTILLNGVTDTAAQVLPGTSVTIGFLVGDVNGNGTVSSSDIAQVKLQAGQEASVTNFRTDVNGNGSVTSSDIALVKSSSGTQLLP
ncbi:MAG: dockerin type I domain-containing protein, partial [Chthoniobacterales bacterium]